MFGQIYLGSASSAQQAYDTVLLEPDFLLHSLLSYQQWHIVNRVLRLQLYTDNGKQATLFSLTELTNFLLDCVQYALVGQGNFM